MIVGMGIDIVEVSRIRALLERHGERFEQRVFTPGEIRYCRAKADAAQHFSARFAAKEAAVKALGSGFGQGIRYTDIQIEHDEGIPQVVFHNRARQIADSLGVSAVRLSISHERTMTAAAVILERFE